MDKFPKVLTTRKMRSTAKNYFPRPFLSEDQALQIFEIKLQNDASPYSPKVRAEEAAQTFGVSSKTIRDIWSRRTWANETSRMARMARKCTWIEQEMVISRKEVEQCRGHSSKLCKSPAVSPKLSGTEPLLFGDSFHPEDLWNNDQCDAAQNFGDTETSKSINNDLRDAMPFDLQETPATFNGRVQDDIDVSSLHTRKRRVSDMLRQLDPFYDDWDGWRFATQMRGT